MLKFKTLANSPLKMSNEEGGLQYWQSFFPVKWPHPQHPAPLSPGVLPTSILSPDPGFFPNPDQNSGKKGQTGQKDPDPKHCI